MNNKKIGYDSLVIIFLIFTCIIIMSYLIAKKTEHFNDIYSSEDLTKIEGSMNQLNNYDAREKLFNSADKTLKKANKKQGILKFEHSNKNNQLLDKYVRDIMLSDVGNPNRILVEDSFHELPSVIEDNLGKYNHEMRKLLNSKRIKQSYILDVLKYKIDTLLNSLKPINEIKKELEDLKKPENRDKVLILKSR